MPESISAGRGAAPPGSAAPGAEQIPPELVSQVADKVYALLVAELRIERELCRPAPAGLSAAGGVKWT